MKIEGLDDEKAEWYYLPYGEEKAKGPVSKRDIDVEWRTHSIYSDTLVYKEGLGGWKKLSEVPELVQLLNIANSEVTEEVLKAREQLKNMGNPLIVASAAGKFAPYQSADGLWHYYDPETKQWKTSKEDPHKTSERKQSEDLRSPLKKPEVAEVGAEVPVELLPPESKEELAKKEEERVYFLNSRRSVIKIQKKALLKKEKRKRYQQNKKKKWYNPKISASVYVTGLPPDISQEELSEYFSKCGILRVDPHTGEKKVKIYEESDGRRKGDALIQYARGESIELALEHLNESEIRPGYKIHVERARFQQKGEEYQPRKKKKTDKLELYRIKTEIERLFTWSEDEVLQKGLKIVVMKGVFTLEEVSKDPNPEQFFKELEEDIKMECEQKLGEVERIVVYEVLCLIVKAKTIAQSRRSSADQIQDTYSRCRMCKVDEWEIFWRPQNKLLLLGWKDGLQKTAGNRGRNEEAG
eukprot:TRINITY_DN1947_c0_g1_i1.p1 TRINITY_DN1947_c0_g1~~TRINITY_DN1947_c0_g1_i1.p1  ORF type:complete len:498 (-),score=72.93 TRINITY_DN1947_c0_g1_i1:3959-5362(-)